MLCRVVISPICSTLKRLLNSGYAITLKRQPCQGKQMLEE